MKKLSKYFIRGLFTLLPGGLTVLILFSFLGWVETLAKSIFTTFASDFYFPGLGLIIGIALICGLGFLTTLTFFEKVLGAAELPFKNVPIIKSIYSAVKSLSDYFSPENKSATEQQVVLIKLPNFPFEVVGLVTRRQLTDLPQGFPKNDHVAVFVPLSYMVGGITIFVSRAHIQKIDMRVEEAMKSALTAWMPHRPEVNSNGD